MEDGVGPFDSSGAAEQALDEGMTRRRLYSCRKATTGSTREARRAGP